MQREAIHRQARHLFCERLPRFGVLFTLIGITLHVSVTAQARKPWTAPIKSAKQANPVPSTTKSVAAGKSLFQQQCVVCHGTKGKGDGPAAVALKPRPGDLTSIVVARQKDGEIQWKIVNGRAPMPTFGKALKTEQIWQIVNYIRTLGPKPTPKPKPPKSKPPKSKPPKSIPPSKQVERKSASELGVTLRVSAMDQARKPWPAPIKAAKQQNPVPSTTKSLAAGKALFQQQCAVCHGTKGKGDGPAAVALKPRPGDLTAIVFVRQKDGEIKWKIVNGRAPMPTFGKALKPEQIWQLVNYIRTLGPKPTPPPKPKLPKSGPPSKQTERKSASELDRSPRVFKQSPTPTKSRKQADGESPPSKRSPREEP